MQPVSRLRTRIELALGWLPTVAAVGCFEGPDPHEQIVRAGLGQPPPPMQAVPIEKEDRAAEHDAEERERCPHGIWCGVPADAALFGIPGDASVDGCPPRIHGNPSNGADPMDPRWGDLSMNLYMKGERVPAPAAAGQGLDAAPKDWCCYDWVVDCVGRPVMHEGRKLIPTPSFGPPTATPSPRHAAAGEQWAADAGEELASVAAFARATLELLALAAPPALVAACHHAALDELRHAQASYALASALLGRPCRPGPVPTAPVRTADFTRLAIDTFIEGCVAETHAALLAAYALPACTHPQAHALLAAIADDESHHAALAWRILAWALEREPTCASHLHALLRRPPRRTDHSARPGFPDLGRPDPATIAAAREHAWHEIIAPTLSRLLADTERAPTSSPRT